VYKTRELLLTFLVSYPLIFSTSLRVSLGSRACV